MSNMQDFPETVEEFMEQYKMTDTEQVYSNGTEYVPIYRMEQWFEHERARGKRDNLSRVGKWLPDETGNFYWICSECGFASEAFAANVLYQYCPHCGSEMRGEK